jgi:hypothetical protein
MDQDTDLDLFQTNIGRTDRNQLFSNDGTGNFTVTHTLISEDAGRPSKGHTWGDFDNDGDLDLFIANGTEGVNEEETFNQLFLNRGDGTFTRVLRGAIVTTPTISAGVASADFDRDGDLDILVANWGANAEENRFYRNDIYGTHWLEIRLRGTSSNSYGIGSKVRVRYIKGGVAVWLTRWLLPQAGYASQDEPILHFGLGEATNVDAIEVTWPSGEIQRLGNMEADRLITITEP